jgi:hypothetical protein
VSRVSSFRDIDNRHVKLPEQADIWQLFWCDSVVVLLQVGVRAGHASPTNQTGVQCDRCELKGEVPVDCIRPTRAIDAAERERGVRAARPRVKFVSVDELLSAGLRG